MVSKMTRKKALAIILSFEFVKTQARVNEAWQFLINDGSVWHLPLLYQEAAHVLIDQRVCKFQEQ